MYRNSLGLKEWTMLQGGAGTWSDGKLTTRIGKNGGSVQTVSIIYLQWTSQKLCEMCCLYGFRLQLTSESPCHLQIIAVLDRHQRRLIC
jgi:hypothetical protein